MVCQISHLFSRTNSLASYIGEEALSRKTILNISTPIQRGTVENWDDAERLVFYAFYDMMRYAPEGNIKHFNE